MSIEQGQALRAVPAALGVLTLLSACALLASDAVPHLFPAEAHAFLAALPLVLIAAAYVVYQAIRRAPPLEWAKAAILALAFLSWAANQICANPRLAALFNDLAVAAFVFDVFLVIIGWPPPPGPSALAEHRVRVAPSKGTRAAQ
jgi:hypothetical protein